MSAAAVAARCCPSACPAARPARRRTRARPRPAASRTPRGRTGSRRSRGCRGRRAPAAARRTRHARAWCAPGTAPAGRRPAGARAGRGRGRSAAPRGRPAGTPRSDRRVRASRRRGPRRGGRVQERAGRDPVEHHRHMPFVGPRGHRISPPERSGLRTSVVHLDPSVGRGERTLPPQVLICAVRPALPHRGCGPVPSCLCAALWGEVGSIVRSDHGYAFRGSTSVLSWRRGSDARQR